MLRLTGEGLVLFLIPFAGYALLLAITQRYPALGVRLGSGPVLRVASLGCGLVIAGLLLFGLFGERHRGAYVPAHIDNGQFVPGRLQ